jgi:hypothetical protein
MIGWKLQSVTNGSSRDIVSTSDGIDSGQLDKVPTVRADFDAQSAKL